MAEDVFRPMKVIFEVSRDGAGLPRLFKFQRLSQACDDRAANLFLAEFSGYGMRVLSSQERWSEDTWRDYRIALALFQHRYTGRLTPSRSLTLQRSESS